jgi:hypothetical protein
MSCETLRYREIQFENHRPQQTCTNIAQPSRLYEDPNTCSGGKKTVTDCVRLIMISYTQSKYLFEYRKHIFKIIALVCVCVHTDSCNAATQ